MQIETIREMCSDDKIIVTQHFVIQCKARDILYSEVKEVIQNGTIIEEYLNSYPYPSCLVFGYTVNNRALHVVVGVTETNLWFITAYEPSLTYWESDFIHRKE